MSEVMTRMNPGEFIGLVAVAGGLLCGLVAIVMGVGLEYRRTYLTFILKKDMLERGMMPEDIQAVLAAGTKNPAQSCKGPVEAEV